MRANPIAPFVTGLSGAAVHRQLTQSAESIVLDAMAIQQIAAPTFAEARRAEYMQARFALLPTIQDVRRDGLDNVYARLPGSDPTYPAIFVSAHTDTVFPADTALTIERTPTQVYGPGIGDNSLGVATLLALPGLIADQPRRGDLWLIANTREEGLGDLGGIRAVLDHFAAAEPPVKIGAGIVMEGIAYNQIYHAGIAVRRLRIAVQAAGGHSWLHFGQPSAIHMLVQIAQRITLLSVPETPRTTYNIGLIEGGHSVNSIATDAALTIDLRSEDPATLALLESAVRVCCTGLDLAGSKVTITVVGDRPAGSIPVTHALVQMACGAIEATGHRPSLRAGSTDANLPLARGIPTVTVGITSGGNAHRLDEYIDLPPIRTGLWQLALLTLAAANDLFPSSS